MPHIYGSAHRRHRLSRAAPITWKAAIRALPIPSSSSTYKSPQNGNKTDPNSRMGYDKSVLGAVLGPTLGAPGSQKATDTKKVQKHMENLKWSIPRDPVLMNCQ